MAKRTKRHTGHYVIATTDTGSVNQRKARLLGPFASAPIAHAMIEPVRKACERTGDRTFRRAAFYLEKITRDVDQPLPRGSLDLSLISLDDVIMASRRKLR